MRKPYLEDHNIIFPKTSSCGKAVIVMSDQILAHDFFVQHVVICLMTSTLEDDRLFKYHVSA